MEQHITNLILEMIGEDSIGTDWSELEAQRYNNTKRNLRDKIPDLVKKIMNLMEYYKK